MRIPLIFFITAILSLSSTAYSQSQVQELSPLPSVERLDLEKVALGEKLFHDMRLSKNNSISCSSCHALSLGGTDRRSMSVGVDGRIGKFNSPTVFNAVFNFRHFWNGRASSLTEQIEGPIHNPDEMASSWPEIVTKLNSETDYQAAFKKSYGSISADNIKDAIVTFEKSLVTSDSKFDRYLKGETKALNDQELAGYKIFKSYGCVSCHQGANVGGNMYQVFGVIGNYFVDRGNVRPEDYGLFNLTGQERDRFKFRVPSLRNVAVTAPYFHDGSVATLPDAVKIMGRYQLGRNLKESEIKSLVLFLESLTGRYNGKDLK